MIPLTPATVPGTYTATVHGHTVAVAQDPRGVWVATLPARCHHPLAEAATPMALQVILARWSAEEIAAVAP